MSCVDLSGRKHSGDITPRHYKVRSAETGAAAPPDPSGLRPAPPASSPAPPGCRPIAACIFAVRGSYWRSGRGAAARGGRGSGAGTPGVRRQSPRRRCPWVLGGHGCAGGSPAWRRPWARPPAPEADTGERGWDAGCRMPARAGEDPGPRSSRRRPRELSPGSPPVPRMLNARRCLAPAGTRAWVARGSDRCRPKGLSLAGAPSETSSPGFSFFPFKFFPGLKENKTCL